jgi:hypothetical protein
MIDDGWTEGQVRDGHSEESGVPREQHHDVRQGAGDCPPRVPGGPQS